MRSHILQDHKPPFTFLSLPVNDAQKEWQKKETIEWVLVVFSCKRWPKKNCKIWRSTYLWATKSARNFTTINHKPSPVWCKHGLRKGKRKRTLLSFPDVAASTYLCLSWWIFLLTAADCINANNQFIAGTWYQVLVPYLITHSLPGRDLWYWCLVPGTMYQEYHQILGPRSSVLYGWVHKKLILCKSYNGLVH